MYISPQVRDLHITKTWPNYALNIIGHPEAKGRGEGRVGGRNQREPRSQVIK